MRDTIMFGEYNVYPRDVEEVVYENNKVLETAVVGINSNLLLPALIKHDLELRADYC